MDKTRPRLRGTSILNKNNSSSKVNETKPTSNNNQYIGKLKSSHQTVTSSTNKSAVKNNLLHSAVGSKSNAISNKSNDNPVKQNDNKKPIYSSSSRIAPIPSLQSSYDDRKPLYSSSYRTAPVPPLQSSYDDRKPIFSSSSRIAPIPSLQSAISKQKLTKPVAIKDSENRTSCLKISSISQKVRCPGKVTTSSQLPTYKYRSSNEIRNKTTECEKPKNLEDKSKGKKPLIKPTNNFTKSKSYGASSVNKPLPKTSPGAHDSKAIIKGAENFKPSDSSGDNYPLDQLRCRPTVNDRCAGETNDYGQHSNIIDSQDSESTCDINIQHNNDLPFDDLLPNESTSRNQDFSESNISDASLSNESTSSRSSRTPSLLSQESERSSENSLMLLPFSTNDMTRETFQLPDCDSNRDSDDSFERDNFSSRLDEFTLPPLSNRWRRRGSDIFDNGSVSNLSLPPVRGSGLIGVNFSPRSAYSTIETISQTNSLYDHSPTRNGQTQAARTSALSTSESSTSGGAASEASGGVDPTRSDTHLAAQLSMTNGHFILTFLEGLHETTNTAMQTENSHLQTGLSLDTGSGNPPTSVAEFGLTHLRWLRLLRWWIMSINQDDDYEMMWQLSEMIGDAVSRGLSAEEISKLSKFTFTSEHETKECAICLSSYVENDDLRRLQCCHDFHVACIDKWLKINAVCPVCRMSLKT